jgi:sporulation protein YqfC
MEDYMPKKFIRKLTDILELPKDVSLGLPFINMIGRDSVFIENHKGIRAFEANSIILNTNIGKLEIKGSNLLIKEITVDIMHIYGNIKAMIFL